MTFAAFRAPTPAGSATQKSMIKSVTTAVNGIAVKPTK